MDQVLQWLETIFHVVLAGFFALTPGTLFWLGVLGIVLLARNLGRSGIFRRLRTRGGSA